MSGFLLDTSVLSAFAPDRAALPPIFGDWLAKIGRGEAWHLPVIAAGEVQKGVAKLRRAGGEKRAQRLEEWLERILSEFGERVLPVTAAIARKAGEMEDKALAEGRHPGLADILIACTAIEHRLTVLTTNNRHFDVLGVAHINPMAVPSDP